MDGEPEIHYRSPYKLASLVWRVIPCPEREMRHAVAENASFHPFLASLIIRGIMAFEGTYETKLLRIVIGFLHVSLLQQLALTRHDKPFHSLTLEEKQSLEAEMLVAVATVASALTEELLQAGLKPPIVH